LQVVANADLLDKLVARSRQEVNAVEADAAIVDRNEIYKFTERQLVSTN
jgi:hypothetical protein